MAGRLALSLSVTLVCLEVALRIAPACIPAKRLVYFRDDLRSRIAKGRFATRDDVVRLERDDGGPDLHLWKPFFVKPYRFTDPGAVDSVRADEIGFSNPPGTYTSNSTLDVVTIGDSFTWAHAVNPTDTWSFCLGQLTGRRVLNLGRGGTGPYEYLQILKRFALTKQPRIVVMNIYEGNDLRDAVAYHTYRRSGRTSGDSGSAVWKHIPVLSGSFVYNLAGSSLEYSLRKWREERTEGAIDFRYRVDPDHAAILFNEQQTDRDEVIYPRRLLAGELEFRVFDDALRAFAGLATEHAFTPILAYSPTASTVYTPVQYNDPALGPLLAEFSQRQRTYFAERARELGMVFVDLTDPLRKAAFPVTGPDGSRLLYYPTSLHYTAQAHQIVAQTLAPIVADLLQPAAK